MAAGSNGTGDGVGDAAGPSDGGLVGTAEAGGSVGAEGKVGLPVGPQAATIALTMSAAAHGGGRRGSIGDTS
jgi:hypothetical protein